MFQEEYKKKYDRLHPSAELIEQTKKLALEKCMEQPEGTDLELYDVWNEENSQLGRHRRWLRIAGGMAAGIAIVASGVYLVNSLQPKSGKGNQVAMSVETPSATICPEETTLIEKEESTVVANTQAKNNQKIETNASSDVMAKLAQMKRGSVTLDYASESRVIFHGDFGILIYSISEERVVENISASEYDKNGNGVHIKVNAEGTKILWYSNDTLTDAELYEVGSGQTQNVDLENDGWEEEVFGQVQSVAGTDADVYVDASRVGQMVVIGGNRYLQLMYEVPESSSQASLAVSIIDLGAKTEQLYSVFGETGRNLEKKQGREYGNYHNEHGIALFESVVEDEPAKEETNETPIPEQTEEPEMTMSVEETVEPLVEETQVPPEP